MEEQKKLSMVCSHDINRIYALKDYLNDQNSKSERWSDVNMDWISTLDRLIHNLQMAPCSYRPASLQDLADNFYTAECTECGWWGSSKLLEGGGQIADTGDHFDAYCPVCGSKDIDDKEEFSDVVDSVKMRIEPLIKEGLCTDGAHHKQWYLSEIGVSLGLRLPYKFEKGIAP